MCRFRRNPQRLSVVQNAIARLRIHPGAPPDELIRSRPRVGIRLETYGKHAYQGMMRSRLSEEQPNGSRRDAIRRRGGNKAPPLSFRQKKQLLDIQVALGGAQPARTRTGPE